jgi:hypothetical protein
MTTTQKTLAALCIFILALFVYVSTQKTPVKDITPVATPTPAAVTPHGICGLSITSHNPNAKASLLKPITISGIVDNTNSVSVGCSWQMFEGQAGTAEAFAFVNNQWKSISKQTPVPVLNWMTNKTTFVVEIGINTGTMNIADGTPLKIVFKEDNVSEESPIDMYTLPLVNVIGELADTPVSIPLTLYIQDKAALAADRCDATVKTTYQVPKTTAVADASLALLFAEELAYYGVYKSVRITNGVAQVNLTANTLPDGRQYSSLSSCESGHLTSVLRDTLTQYNTITSVELYRPAGKIEF